jgi:hypothetical protein
MCNPFHRINGLELQNASGVRGVAGGQPVRLTRTLDGASMLLHEIGPDVFHLLAQAEFEATLPDFNAPFVTSFSGILSYQGKRYLVEPIPSAVPLLAVWRQVLRNDSANVSSMLTACARQLQQAINCLHSHGQGHGALCAENIALTTSGFYGILRAGVLTPRAWLCLRPATDSGDSAFNCRTINPNPANDSVEQVLHELIATAQGSTAATQTAPLPRAAPSSSHEV